MEEGNISTSEEDLIKQRKEKFVKLLKTKYDYLVYFFLAIIVFLTVRIRTSNLSKLRDITDGSWTLGPDLDPWLFTRWAKYIVENGSLFAIDNFRYVPLGFRPQQDLILHPYMIAWFHKLASLFGSGSVVQSAAIYPVFFFALTTIAFFFMTRALFIEKLGKNKASLIALLSSVFLSTIPELLARTIAGIPEKESAAFFFMFLSFYFFLISWRAKKQFSIYTNSVLAGLSTAAMGLVWGGVSFVFLTIAPTMLICFLLGKVDREKTIAYGIYIASGFIVMNLFSLRYSIKGLLSSLDTGLLVAVFFIIVLDSIISNTRLNNYLKNSKLAKIPPKALSLILSVILLAIISTIFFGPQFIPSKVNGLVASLVKPATSRLIQTVAENRQPYFTEWSSSFGPIIKKIPVFFWLFFSGSIYLFHHTLEPLRKKERNILVISYMIFLLSLVFSRYSPDSRFNGENSLSISFYSLGFILFVLTIGFYYHRYHKYNEEERFKKVDSGYILLFTFFFLSIIAARGIVRLVMVLAIPSSIIASYFCISLVYSAISCYKEKKNKIFVFIITGVVLIATVISAHTFYVSSSSSAVNYAPTIYNQQWQKSMAWVRENTPSDAVFAHWWDYGYWIQSIGERATVLDGGNARGYWNHMMGRYALTGSDNREALNFLYAHNVTHFLIDSTDIGKYGAFSIIGSDVNYDRSSYIPTFIKEPSQTQERKNSTAFVYLAGGGAGLDEDIFYEENESKIFLPSGSAFLAAIVVERNFNGDISQPIGLFIYQQNQYTLPLRYAYDNELIDFGSGIDAGVFIFPNGIQSSTGMQVDGDGALLYLSKRTVKSQLARLYLYKEDNPNFKLVNSEDDFLVAQIKSQSPDFSSDFINFGGLRGPLRIWEVKYPGDIKFDEKFIKTEYPRELIVRK
ncbi:hypothetical protein HY450_02010 [Candidatus Pacearchaeota archaeon]|nr:hypothetical protein [Candidatus Pacearchaeota archaeon]